MVALYRVRETDGLLKEHFKKAKAIFLYHRLSSSIGCTDHDGWITTLPLNLTSLMPLIHNVPYNSQLVLQHTTYNVQVCFAKRYQNPVEVLSYTSPTIN